MDNDTVDREAERLLHQAADAMTTPRTGECLYCFVARMLNEFGCDTTLRFALRFRDQTAPRAVALATRLGSMGGFCDCELFMNGMRVADHLCTVDAYGDRCGPSERPACVGVRRGSTRPCSNWVRRSRWD